MSGDDRHSGTDRELHRGQKSEAAFRTISEVAAELDVPTHVLRFWETRFDAVQPMKRGGGRRYYRPEDVVLLRTIRDHLYRDGYTIKGVQKLLAQEKAAAPARGEPEPPPRRMPEPAPRAIESDSRQPGLPLDLPSIRPEHEVAEARPHRIPAPGGLSAGQVREIRTAISELEDLKARIDRALGGA